MGEIPEADPEATTVPADDAPTELSPSQGQPLDTGLAPGGRVGSYRLLEVAGVGGMGQVWKARDTALQRTVALKLLTLTSADALARFRREALLAADLQHPHIAQVYAFVESRPPAIAMQYIDGVPLSRYGGDSVARLADAAEAVHCAHERGVLHRDLKPSNLLVDIGGRVFVVDFGLGRRISADEDLTRSGTLLGTPGYMAPEQVNGSGADARTDVYGLGATLYALLAGRPPHTGPNPYATARAVLEDEPTPPPGPPDLAAIALQALAKDPARRYPSARAFAEDVRRALAHEPVRARRATWLDRLAKRVRRRPLVYGLAALLALVLLASAGLLVAQWLEQRALIAELAVRGDSLRALAADLEEQNRQLTLSATYERRRRDLTALAERLALRHDSAGLAAQRSSMRALGDSLDARLEEFPEEPALYLLRAELRTLAHDRAGALEDHTRALELPPSPLSAALEIAPRALYGRFRLLARRLCLSFLNQRTASVEERFAEARVAFAAELAVELERDFGGLPPALDEELSLWRALILAETGVEARGAELLGRGGGRPELLFVLGLHHQLSGRHDAAIDAYDASLALDWNQPEVHHARSLCFFGNSGAGPVRDLTAVRRGNREALRLDPRMSVAHALLAVAIGELEGMAAAEEALDGSLALLPEAPELLRLRALARRFQGDLDGGLADLERGIAVAPELDELHALRGDFLRDLARFDEAVLAYDTLLGLEPEHWDGRYNRALCHLLAGAPARALGDVAWMCAARPDDPNGLNLAGAVRAEAGDLEGAVEAFEALLVQFPRDPMVLGNAARALEGLGRTAAAAAHLRTLLEVVDPDSEEAEQAREALARLGE